MDKHGFCDLVYFSRSSTAGPRTVRPPYSPGRSPTITVPSRQVSSAVVTPVPSAVMPILHLSLPVSERSSVVPALTFTTCFNCPLAPIHSESDNFDCSHHTSTLIPGPPSALGFRPILLRADDTPRTNDSPPKPGKGNNKKFERKDRRPVPSRHHPTWRRGIQKLLESIQTEVRWRELIAQYQEGRIESFEVQDDPAADKDRGKALLDEAMEAIDELKAFLPAHLTRWATRRAVTSNVSFPIGINLGGSISIIARSWVYRPKILR